MCVNWRLHVAQLGQCAAKKGRKLSKRQKMLLESAESVQTQDNTGRKVTSRPLKVYRLAIVYSTSPEPTKTCHNLFISLFISRPILKALTPLKSSQLLCSDIFFTEREALPVMHTNFLWSVVLTCFLYGRYRLGKVSSEWESCKDW